jgi:asparagine synthase (glutamine-hydrolysing)
MCGIFGYIGLAPESQEQFVYHSSRLLRHRGPDDHGFESGSGWGFGFRRLSILDLSELGHQPMSTPDGRFWLVFNGEVYNYIELRVDLEKRGEKFRSTSDTEVLLRLLALQGPQALGQLNGMFALAFVDTKNHTYILARDRLGQKPLYYYT